MAETPLTFSVNGRTLPVPLVRATVHGHEGWLIVDTGASHHALARGFAEANQLVRAPAPAGQDHVGKPVEVAAAAEGNWQLGAYSRSVTDAVIVPTPPAFTPLGIIGFLSPQHLADHGYVILDFPAGRMSVLASGSSDALHAWLRKHYATVRVLELPRETGPSPRQPFILAALGDQPPVIAQLDTGGSTTEFDDALLPAAGPTDASSNSLTINGPARAARVVTDQFVTLGGQRFGPLKVKARSPKPGFSALIGMDLLRATVVVIPNDPREPIRLLVAPAAR